MLYEDNPQEEPDYTVLTKDEFEGKGIVVTGDFPHIGRGTVEYYVEELGAKLRTSVTGKTFMVVAGLDHGPYKIQKLKEVNTQRQLEGKQPVWCLNELEFYHLLKNFGVYKKY